MAAGGGLTPACAGSTPAQGACSARSGTHPRLRGEHPAASSAAVTVRDSPPLARGAPRDALPDERQVGLTPACAGSTGHEHAGAGAVRTHPRLRGEHMNRDWHTLTVTDSPPLARGAPSRRAHRDRLVGLTPACAGSTHPTIERRVVAGTHPRLRGEHCSVTWSAGTWWDSPPLARGAPLARQSFDRLPGLTPACAGSTSCRAPALRRPRTHPRLRGEHDGHLVFLFLGRDSPPLARGALADAPAGADDEGLTPACAGSTCCQQ